MTNSCFFVMRHVLYFSNFDDKMNSILKIFFRQTEHFLRLTKTSIHAFQLIQKYLHSSCFLFQRALYRVQALRQIRGELPIRINDDIIIK